MWFSINLNGFGDLSAKIVKYRSPPSPSLEILTIPCHDTDFLHRLTFLFFLLLLFFFIIWFSFVSFRITLYIKVCRIVPYNSRNRISRKIRIRIFWIIVGNFRDFESLDSGTIQKSAISDFNSTVIGCDRSKALIVTFQSLSNRLCSIIADFTSRFVQNQKFRDLK